jgi:hypothetical protein
LKWIILTQNLLYNYLEWHIYILTTFYMDAISWISCFYYFLLRASFEISLFYFYWKLAMFFFLFCFVFFFFLDNTHGLFSHFDLYSVRNENKFILKNLRNLSLFFVYCNIVIMNTIPNTCRNLLSLVVHSSAKPKLFCINIHDKPL